jgi:hypothetical protein
MSRPAIDRAGSFSLNAGQLADERCEVIWEPVTTVCSRPDDCLWGLAPLKQACRRYAQLIHRLLSANIGNRGFRPMSLKNTAFEEALFARTSTGRRMGQ